MTDDGYALLRAIEANPDEDTPRLAYADWLEEHASDDGDRARAEFIRVQCARQRLIFRSAEGTALWVREQRLQPLVESSWRKLPGLDRVERFWLDRGFPSFGFTADQFIKLGAAVVESAPLVTVVLGDSKADVAKLAKCPALAHLAQLHLNRGSELLANGLATLFGSPHWRNLQRVTFYDMEVRPLAATAFARADLPKLRHLSFHSRALTSRVLTILADAGVLARLESLQANHTRLKTDDAYTLVAADLSSMTELDLSWNHGLSAGVERLVRSPKLANLRKLRLHGTCNGNGDAVALAEVPHFAKLTLLELGGNMLGDRTAEALATANRPELVELNLSDNVFTAVGISALFGSHTLTGLRTLKLWNSREVRADSFRAIARAQGLPALEQLELASTALACVDWVDKQAVPGDSEAFEEFIRSPLVARLKRLELNGNALGRPGVKALAASPAVRGLVALGLSYNAIDDAGVITLAASENLTSLRELHLSEYLGERAVRAVIDSPHLRNLAVFGASIHNASAELRAALTTRFPNTL